MTTYDELLEVFWRSHDPTAPLRSTQYRAAIYCHDETQRLAAEASRDRAAEQLGESVETEIFVGAPYYPAEGYHQKWRLRRQDDLFEALRGHFPSEAAFLASVTAAKMNGFIGQPRDVLDPVIDRLGLPAEAEALLRPTGS